MEPRGLSIHAGSARGHAFAVAQRLRVATLGAIVVALAACRAGNADTPPPSRTVSTAALAPDVEPSGRVAVVASQPSRESEIACTVAPEADAEVEATTVVPARIVRWFVSHGERVRAGAALVVLDSRDVAEHRSALARARADVADLRARLAEETRMMTDGATTERALRDARIALQRAEADVEAARRALSVAQASEHGDGGRFTLRAAASGSVVSREGTVGRAVAAGARLVVIVDLSRLRIRAQLPEALSAVRVGERASVSLRARAEPIAAHVIASSTVLDRASHTRTVDLLPDAPIDLLLGESGTVLFEHRSPAPTARGSGPPDVHTP